MLTKITLKNFKKFQNNSFPLSKLNLLTGVNGKGKSTLLQSILLIYQSIDQDANTNQAFLQGKYVELGTFEDVQNRYLSPKQEDILIEYDFSDDFQNPKINLTLTFDFTKSKDDDLLLDTKQIKMVSPNKFWNQPSKETTEEIVIEKQTDIPYREKWKGTNINFERYESVLARFLYQRIIVGNQANPLIHKQVQEIFKFNKIHYIAADRLGSQLAYQVMPLGRFINVGKKGEATASVLLKKGDNEIVSQQLCLPDGENTLAVQTSAWLSELFGKTILQVNKIGMNQAELSFELDNGHERLKAVNVGFGYSYALSIIVSGLIAKEGEILIVENPEAHLHPRAQSKLTKFLAKVASCGVQVFIESHSEHILNGLRVCALDAGVDISNEDMSILYFQDKENEPFVKLDIQKDGSIKNWVEGFFDQQELDLSEIFKLSRSKK